MPLMPSSGTAPAISYRVAEGQSTARIEQTQETEVEGPPAYAPTLRRRTLRSLFSDPDKLQREFLEAAERVDVGQLSSLVTRGANVNVLSVENRSNALHKVFKHATSASAAEKQKVLMAIGLLLREHVNMYSLDVNGNTPLLIAEEKGWLRDQEMCRVLTQYHISFDEATLRGMQQHRQARADQRVAAADAELRERLRSSGLE
ncbi:hypothetical protein [Roseateles sp. YR242]|uniref:hypothetical protein n=1 Tax=Roseateles sp. YR242 TaxID=1855305 RepID=UPI0011608A05|nr:hypothetical protein [Roseateles sp. YR242]